MADRRVWLLAVTLVTFLMVLSSLGIAATGAHAAAPSAGGAPAVHAAAAPTPSAPAKNPWALPTASIAAVQNPTATTPAPVANPTEGTVNPAVATAERLIAEKKLNPSSVFFPAAPNPTATPGGKITPSNYIANPSPMGLADLGQGAGGAYVYNTSSFEASLHLNSFQDYNPGYAGWDAPPNFMTWQLNTVTVNVTIPGQADGVFWIQNVVHFNGTSLQFENNIWNMSGSAAVLNNGTLLNYNGTLVPGAFYYIYGPTFQVTYPFTLNLFNNITSRGGHPGVYFNYSLTNTTTGNHVGSFDYVTFNGAASHSAPPAFQVNGKVLNPLSLYWDAELIFGGNGGGANAVITELNGTSTLKYWDATSTSFKNVPSAYDYGVNTGETADGVAAAYQGATELLSQGPSFLQGLWNTTNSTWGPAAQPGWINVDLTGLPNYGFAFASNVSSLAFTHNPTGNLSYAPSDVNGVTVTHLPPPPASDPYVFRAYANGYDWDNITVTNNATGTAVFALAANSHYFYTPIYLSTTAQVAAFGAAGLSGVTYSAPDNGLWVNHTEITMGVPFNFLNDFRFPEFMLFAGLNLSVNVSLNHLVQNPYSFQYWKYNSVRVTPYYFGLTQGYFFNYGAGVFSVTNTTVIGSAYLHYDAEFTPLSSVEFWQTSFSQAGWITTDQDSFGVAVENSSYVLLQNISGQGGANAIAVLNSFYVLAYNITANGTDGGGGVVAVGEPTWGVYLSYDNEVLIQGLTATNGSILMFDNGTNNLLVFNVTAVNDLVLDANDGELGFPVLVVGGLGLEFDNWYFANSSSPNFNIGFDVDLEEVQDVFVNNFTVIGTIPGSAPAAPIFGLTFDALGGLFGMPAFLANFVSSVNVTNVSASLGAYAVFAYRAQFVNESNVFGGNSAITLWTDDFFDLDQWDVSAGANAVGSLTEEGTGLSVWNVTAGQESAGVLTAQADSVSVRNVNATSPYLGQSYFDLLIFVFPNVAEATVDDSGATVSNVSSTNNNYGVMDNLTTDLSVSGVTTWGGLAGLLLNLTTDAELSSVFAFGATIGGEFLAVNTGTITASTFEGSSSYGVEVTGGAALTFTANNFVANNGALTNGSFSASHVQAAVNGGATSVSFTSSSIGNYWSDWSGVGSYVINGAVSDTAPYAAFVSNWLEINETGLPDGTSWGFTLNTVSYSTSAPLVFIPSWSLPDATLGFVVLPPAGYAGTPASGSIVYTGSDANQTIVFSRAHYNVTFQETGLPSGATWTVTFNGTTLSAVAPSGPTFSVYPGTYAYTVTVPANYTVAPQTGSVVVVGVGKIVPITFTHTAVAYTVTFVETGLPAGTSWSVTVGGTDTITAAGNLTFSEFNGTHGFTVPDVNNETANPSVGTVTVAGVAQVVDITFSATTIPTYTVTFTETGLAPGTQWSVMVGSASESSSNGTVVFNLPNGTETWTVTAITGYTIEQATGSVQVNGLAVGVPITFVSTTTYTLTFTETGLGSGTNWSVTIGTVTHYSTTSTITFQEPSGSVSYSVGTVSGYTATPVTGSVTLTGAATGVQVVFSGTGTTTSSNGGLTSTEWVLIGLVIAVIVIVLIVALVMRGRGGSGTSGQAPPAETTPDGETYSAPAPWSEQSPPGGTP
jgi:hypothetical protein